MSLLYLAPDIQEEILFLGRMESSRGRLHLRQTRPIAADARLQPAEAPLAGTTPRG